MNHNDKDRFLETLLDNTLLEYGDAEPRVGLENRVLANLQTKLEHRAGAVRSWWALGSALMAAAVVIVIAASLIRTVPRTQEQAVESAQAPRIAITWSAQHSSPPTRKVQRQDRPAPRRAPDKPTAQPKFEIFPYPQPLSEQEMMLQQYVSEHRDHAVLVARAQTNLMKSDRREFFPESQGNETKDSMEPRR